MLLQFEPLLASTPCMQPITIGASVVPAAVLTIGAWQTIVPGETIPAGVRTCQHLPFFTFVATLLDEEDDETGREAAAKTGAARKYWLNSILSSTSQRNIWLFAILCLKAASYANQYCTKYVLAN